MIVENTEEQVSVLTFVYFYLIWKELIKCQKAWVHRLFDFLLK